MAARKALPSMPSVTVEFVNGSGSVRVSLPPEGETATGSVDFLDTKGELKESIALVPKQFGYEVCALLLTISFRDEAQTKRYLDLTYDGVDKLDKFLEPHCRSRHSDEDDLSLSL